MTGFAPYAAACILLLGGGAAKAVRPSSTANALRVVGLPVGASIVRAGGVVEVLIAANALVNGGRLGPALVGASYVALAGFVALAIVRHAPLSSCGCFGEPDSPPTVVHIVVDLAAATTAAAALLAVNGAPSLDHVVDTQPLGGVPLLVLAAVTAYLAYLSLTVLPRVMTLVGSSPWGRIEG